MLCKDLMKTRVECVKPTDSVVTAARRMRDENIGFLPVCDEARRAMGTLTDRDLCIRVLAENRPLTTMVREAMSTEVISCRPNDDIQRAHERMSQHHKSRMLVVDDQGRVQGVISLSDLAGVGDGIATQTMREVSSREARL